mmetsp:Transcript_38842/g.89700  ORF Transcript_38842/g.89700 Transcript_38842/m.89700 type:complete len:414 (-) Transcript_38842:483-1724(-)
MSMTQSSAPALDAFVIRKTFLELEDEAPAMQESRCRSVSDYTDARRIRSWSSCSAQDGWLHAVKGLEAVLEAESDTDVPEDEVSRTDSRSSTLSAEMLSMLEPDDIDDTRRARTRTSSTLFWLSHEATPPLDDEVEASLMAPAQPSACTHSDDVQGHTHQDVDARHIRPEDVYMQSFMPTYMGSFLPPLCPVLPMPWYPCQSVLPVDSSAQQQQQLRRLDSSSSSLELPESDSKQSLDSRGSDANEEDQASKLSKKKQRRSRPSVWQSASITEEAESEPTTVMLRNLPNRYTRKMFLRMLDLHGFRLDYDFLYLPIDFKHRVNLGYAFVNMASHESAVRLKETLDGFKDWAFDSQKVCEAVWASPHQGLAPNIERYRNSPVMHDSVSDEFKPLLFKAGTRVAFPRPTKAIRAP